MDGVFSGIFANERNYEVRFGLDCTAQIREVLERHAAGRPMIVMPRSLGKVPLPATFGLGDPVIFSADLQHGPIPLIEKAAVSFREEHCDSLISYGGSSAVDFAKGIAMLIGHGSLPDLAGAARRQAGGMGISHIDAAGTLPPLLAVPTTLSGAEFTYQAGLTDAEGRKIQYYHRGSLPKTIFLDGRLAVATPGRLWVSTAIKAIDHNVERLYSVNHQPLSDALALESTRMITSELRSSVAGSPDPQVRQRLLLAAWMAQFSTRNVNVGVGHAVDHQIGALYDIPHGIIACVILPHAVRFNEVQARDQLARLAGYLDADGPDSVAGTLSELIRGLGLPLRLRDLGVGRDRFDLIAERSLVDTAITGNPRLVESPAEIRDEILERAW